MSMVARMLGQGPDPKRRELWGHAAATADGPLLRLLDEELAVMDGPTTEQLVPMPYLETLSAEQREGALATALRSLRVRGVVVDEPGPADGPPAGTESTVSLDRLAKALMEARRSASMLVLITRRGGPGVVHRAMYFQGQDAVLHEQVEPSGVHALMMLAPAQALHELKLFVDPFSVAGTSDGPIRTASVGDVAEGLVQVADERECKAVTTISRLTLAPDGTLRDRRLSVYALIDSVRLTESNGLSEPNGVSEADDGRTLRIRDVSAATLTAALRAMLASS
jgi:hypothetical protein